MACACGAAGGSALTDDAIVLGREAVEDDALLVAFEALHHHAEDVHGGAVGGFLAAAEEKALKVDRGRRAA